MVEPTRSVVSPKVSDRSVDHTSSSGPVDINISLSGGGVRAAAFALGALQALQEEEGLVYGDTPARHLTCVSGGSYIASTLVLSTGRDEFPLAVGGPVEGFLRRNCRYLYEQPGRIWGVVGSVLARLLANLLLIAITIFVVGAVVGAVYQATDPPYEDSVEQAFHWVVGVAAFVGVLAGCTRVIRNWDKPGADNPRRRDTWLKWMSWGGLVVAAFVGVVFVLLPTWLGNVGNASITAGGDVGTVHDSGTGGSWWDVTTWGGSGTWATVVSIVAILLGASNSKGTPANEGTGRITVRVRSTLWKWRAPIANFLALIAGPILLASIAGASLAVGYTNDVTSWAGAVWVIAVVLVLLAWWQTDVVNWSLHPPYRDRLFSCFGAMLGETGDEVQSVRQTKLSAVGPSDTHRVPSIKVCAALNVSTRAVTPAGSHVLPWVFTPEIIGVPTDVPGRKKPDGSQDAKLHNDGETGTAVHWKTQDLENAVASSNDLMLRLAVQSASAMAAAAVSPSMGRMTRAPLRMLMAMFNVRLGVWVPNPMNAKQQEAVSRILSAQQKNPPDSSKAKWRSWSGPQYLFLELFGANSIYRKWVYVTDGGHYENLGLVEALRDDKVRTVVCIDAAGDPPGRTTTLAQALALARSELGFEVVAGDLEIFKSLEGSEKGNFRCNATHSVFTLEKGPRHHRRTVHVIVIRLGIVDETPSDIRDYARQHPTFPYDSTANQLYKADRFDAYRALGWDNVKRALRDPLVRTALDHGHARIAASSLG